MKKILLLTIILLSAVSVSVMAMTEMNTPVESVENTKNEIGELNGALTDAGIAFEDTSRSVIESGMCGDTVVWTLDSEGFLKISGAGEMDNARIDYLNFMDNIKKVEIGDEVTAVCEMAFHDCKKLRSVTLGKGVKKIGSYAFEDTGIQEIVIPDSVTEIGERAFDGCVLFEVEFGKGLKKIDDYAMGKIVQKEIVLPQGLEYIGEGAFSHDNFESVEIPDSVTYMGDFAFSDCTKLKSVVIGDGLEEIPYKAFEHCNIKSLVMGENIQTIGQDAFWGNYKLESLVLKDKLVKIGDGAFAFTNLKRVVFPVSLEISGVEAFFSSGIETVYYKGSEEQYEKIQKLLPRNEEEDELTKAHVVYNFEYINGDSNSDIEIDIEDVILLAQYCAEWQSALDTVNPASADTNGDGSVDIRDVILLAQYCAGYDVALG